MKRIANETDAADDDNAAAAAAAAKFKRSSPLVCLFFDSPHTTDDAVVYTVDTGVDGRMNRIARLRRKGYFDCGYATLGSKVYAFGGQYLARFATTYPKNVFICDLNEKPKVGIRYRDWVEGPSLQAGKPNPVVVVLKEKIYALAGHNAWPPPTNIAPNPAFELFDPSTPGGGAWTPLPDPPFLSFYGDSFSILGYTVIDDKFIYVRLRSPDQKVCHLYSFDTVGGIWKDHSSSDCLDNLIAHNLSKHPWCSRVDVVKNKMYRVAFCRKRGVRVYAYDLSSKVPEEESHDRHAPPVEEEQHTRAELEEYFRILVCGFGMDTDSDSESDPDDCLNDDSICPVSGFDEVSTLIKCDAYTSGFVTYLGDETFCLFCFYDPKVDPELKKRYKFKKHLVCVCTFQVVEKEVDSFGSVHSPPKRRSHSLHALNLHCRTYQITRGLGKPDAWSIM